MFLSLIGICFLTLRSSGRIAFASGPSSVILSLHERAASSFFGILPIVIEGRVDPRERLRDAPLKPAGWDCGGIQRATWQRSLCRSNTFWILRQPHRNVRARKRDPVIYE